MNVPMSGNLNRRYQLGDTDPPCLQSSIDRNADFEKFINEK